MNEFDPELKRQNAIAKRLRLRREQERKRRENYQQFMRQHQRQPLKLVAIKQRSNNGGNDDR